MTDAILVGVISGIFGVLSAAVPALRAIRKQPTRRTTDAISLVDASGTVIGNLSDEIHRLDLALDNAHIKAKEALEQIAALKTEVERRPTRDELLETIEKLRTQITGLGETPANGPRAS